ncbi:MAG TPA: AAA family ATPase [Chryseosolibacter sp.]
MNKSDLVITKLEGFSGIRLRNEAPLVFKPGINLLVGRNGCGKTNLLRLIQRIATDKGDLAGRIETSFLLKKASRVLQHNVKSIEDAFGEPTLVEYHLGGLDGNIKIKIKNVPQTHVLNNLTHDLNEFQNHIEIVCTPISVKHTIAHSSANPPKMEMSGYILGGNLFSFEHDNKFHATMQGPIRSVSEFVKKRLVEFYRSEEFIQQITHLEGEVNRQLDRFLGTTSKKIKIHYHDIARNGKLSLSIMDHDNYIESATISSGEATLLNLVFALSSAKAERCDILSLDEPDIHMHDDMIQVLIEELVELSTRLPDCIIIVASHSTSLIEKLAARGPNAVNIITFDSGRNVANSQDDIELINALQRNGVSFSPLMLSRRNNIFIENLVKGRGDGPEHIFRKFFSRENVPNIIPIGNSGNVQDSESFSRILEELLTTADIQSVGIQDGDIWFKQLLRNYIPGNSKLTEFVNTLKSQRGMYIRPNSNKPREIYFNCWEIENLYLMDELLSCWQTSAGHLTKETYVALLRENQAIISSEYFDTVLKSVTRIRLAKGLQLTEVPNSLNKQLEAVNGIINDIPAVKSRMQELVQSILTEDLLNWVPGKEIKRLLENNRYSFDDAGFDYERCGLSKQVREILKA